MEAKVYYLNWDRKEEKDDEFWDMDRIRNGEEEPDGLEYYRKVGRMVKDSKNEVWEEAQRGYKRNQWWLNERGERSMCVGDIVNWGEEWYLVARFGFEELEGFKEAVEA